MSPHRESLGLIAVATAGAQDKFYFSLSPEDVAAPAGSAVTLSCAVSEGRDVAYSWRLNGRPLQPSPRRQLLPMLPGQGQAQGHTEGARLRISRLDRARDQGEVACVATNTSSSFSLTSRAATITVLCEYTLSTHCGRCALRFAWSR